MPKTRERLTKKAVMDQVVAFRGQLSAVMWFTPEQSKAAYAERFPGRHMEEDHMQRLRSLLMSYTYHLTNVLGLE